MIQPNTRRLGPVERHREIPNESDSYEFDTVCLPPSIGSLCFFETECNIKCGDQYHIPVDRYHFSAFVFIALAIGGAEPGDFSATSQSSRGTERERAHLRY
ncbi:hypothetical protein BDM02DRAFT_247280 [Thelephora ganbajun]|uniref:Uncharacterized protein n=1 Tax=Thelephora ganbajun TaxID=370292 RepID=A0ACB6ZAF8_THEGA|nr:hypothetical protein BDM02DRAFT_247280 [Thelephora ganbajun]